MQSALLVLLGTVLGAALTWLTNSTLARRQHRWDLEARDDARTQEREREVRERADLHAQRAIAAADRLIEILHRNPMLSLLATPPRDPPERRVEYKGQIDALRAAGVFFPEPLLSHVNHAVDLIANADEIGAERTAPLGGRALAWAAAEDLRAACGAFLRGEPVPDLSADLRLAVEAFDAIEERWAEMAEAALDTPEEEPGEQASAPRG